MTYARVAVFSIYVFCLAFAIPFLSHAQTNAAAGQTCSDWWKKVQEARNAKPPQKEPPPPTCKVNAACNGSIGSVSGQCSQDQCKGTTGCDGKPLAGLPKDGTGNTPGGITQNPDGSYNLPEMEVDQSADGGAPGGGACSGVLCNGGFSGEAQQALNLSSNQLLPSGPTSGSLLNGLSNVAQNGFGNQSSSLLSGLSNVAANGFGTPVAASPSSGLMSGLSSMAQNVAQSTAGSPSWTPTPAYNFAPAAQNALPSSGAFAAPPSTFSYDFSAPAGAAMNAAQVSPPASPNWFSDTVPAMWQSAQETAQAAWDKVASYLIPPDSAFNEAENAFPIAPEAPIKTASLPTTDQILDSMGLLPNSTEVANQLAGNNALATQDFLNDVLGDLREGEQISTDDLNVARAIAENVRADAQAAYDQRSFLERTQDWLGLQSQATKDLSSANAQLNQLQNPSAQPVDLGKEAVALKPSDSLPRLAQSTEELRQSLESGEASQQARANLVAEVQGVNDQLRAIYDNPNATFEELHNAAELAKINAQSAEMLRDAMYNDIKWYDPLGQLAKVMDLRSCPGGCLRGTYGQILLDDSQKLASDLETSAHLKYATFPSEPIEPDISIQSLPSVEPLAPSNDIPEIPVQTVSETPLSPGKVADAVPPLPTKSPFDTSPAPQQPTPPQQPKGQQPSGQNLPQNRQSSQQPSEQQPGQQGQQPGSGGGGSDPAGGSSGQNPQQTIPGSGSNPQQVPDLTNALSDLLRSALDAINPISGAYGAVPKQQGIEDGQKQGLFATQPTDNPASPPKFAFGDSIAEDIKDAKKLDGAAVKSKQPDWVLDQINAYIKDNPGKLEGEKVILSSGMSNAAPTNSEAAKKTAAQRAEDDAYAQKKLEVVEKQIDAIKAAGGKPILLGVGTAYPNKLDESLKDIAAKKGADFVEIKPYLPSKTDGVHPIPERVFDAVVASGNTKAPPAQMSNGRTFQGVPPLSVQTPQPGDVETVTARTTFYAPGAGGTIEGGFETSKPNLEGKRIPKTLDDVRRGDSEYVTLAVAPENYGKFYDMGDVEYTSPEDGKRYVLTDDEKLFPQGADTYTDPGANPEDESDDTTYVKKKVTGYGHDTGSAFREQEKDRNGKPIKGTNCDKYNTCEIRTRKFDVAVGDFRPANKNPFTGKAWTAKSGSAFVDDPQKQPFGRNVDHDWAQVDDPFGGGQTQVAEKAVEPPESPVKLPFGSAIDSFFGAVGDALAGAAAGGRQPETELKMGPQPPTTADLKARSLTGDTSSQPDKVDTRPAGANPNPPSKASVGKTVADIQKELGCTGSKCNSKLVDYKNPKGVSPEVADWIKRRYSGATSSAGSKLRAALIASDYAACQALGGECGYVVSAHAGRNTGTTRHPNSYAIDVNLKNRAQQGDYAAAFMAAAHKQGITPGMGFDSRCPNAGSGCMHVDTVGNQRGGATAWAYGKGCGTGSSSCISKLPTQQLRDIGKHALDGQDVTDTVLADVSMWGKPAEAPLPNIVQAGLETAMNPEMSGNPPVLPDQGPSDVSDSAPENVAVTELPGNNQIADSGLLREPGEPGPVGRFTRGAINTALYAVTQPFVWGQKTLSRGQDFVQNTWRDVKEFGMVEGTPVRPEAPETTPLQPTEEEIAAVQPSSEQSQPVSTAQPDKLVPPEGPSQSAPAGQPDVTVSSNGQPQPVLTIPPEEVALVSPSEQVFSPFSFRTAPAGGAPQPIREIGPAELSPSGPNKTVVAKSDTTPDVSVPPHAVASNEATPPPVSPVAWTSIPPVGPTTNKADAEALEKSTGEVKTALTKLAQAGDKMRKVAKQPASQAKISAAVKALNGITTGVRGLADAVEKAAANPLISADEKKLLTDALTKAQAHNNEMRKEMKKFLGYSLASKMYYAGDLAKAIESNGADLTDAAKDIQTTNESVSATAKEAIAAAAASTPTSPIKTAASEPAGATAPPAARSSATPANATPTQTADVPAAPNTQAGAPKGTPTGEVQKATETVPEPPKSLAKSIADLWRSAFNQEPPSGVQGGVGKGSAQGTGQGTGVGNAQGPGLGTGGTGGTGSGQPNTQSPMGSPQNVASQGPTPPILQTGTDRASDDSQQQTVQTPAGTAGQDQPLQFTEKGLWEGAKESFRNFGKVTGETAQTVVGWVGGLTEGSGGSVATPTSIGTGPKTASAVTAPPLPQPANAFDTAGGVVVSEPPAPVGETKTSDTKNVIATETVRTETKKTGGDDTGPADTPSKDPKDRAGEDRTVADPPPPPSFEPSPSSGGGGGGFLGGGMSLLNGLLQGVMGWFTGSQRDQQSASNATQPTQPTQPSQPTQPAQQVVGAITANPSLIDASSTTQLSWASVGTDVSSSTCAVISADFSVIKRGGQDGTLTSPIIAESTRFGLVCNAHNATDKLLNETLVRVRGDDTDPPPIFDSTTVSANASGQSGTSASGSGTNGQTSGAGQTGVSQQLGATPNDVRTCDPEQPIDPFIRCLCEAEPNSNGCAIPPGGLRQ